MIRKVFYEIKNNFIFLFYKFFVAPASFIWKDYDVFKSSPLEILMYMMAGIHYSLILTVFVLNRRAIASNFAYIQTYFIKWSLIRGIDPNSGYEKHIKSTKRVIVPALIVVAFILFGPLLATLNDLGNIPLSDRSHFPIFWPQVSTYL